MKHAIRFENDALTFAASHFITFGEPEKVEALHGHNFRIKAEIAGPLNRRAYVVDFVVAFDSLKKICESLSHKVLLPRDHPYIKIKNVSETCTVSMPPLNWTFPKDDTIILPLKNTTTEAIAEYISFLFRRDLEKERAFEASTESYQITIELEETHGMWAICRT